MSGIISRMFSKPTKVTPVVENGEIKSITINSNGHGYDVGGKVVKYRGGDDDLVQSSTPQYNTTVTSKPITPVAPVPPTTPHQNLLKPYHWTYSNGSYWADARDAALWRENGRIFKCPHCKVDMRGTSKYYGTSEERKQHVYTHDCKAVMIIQEPDHSPAKFVWDRYNAL